jgi:hypothetical protein
VLQLLAHAVVLYQVTHHFLQPLYQLWLQPNPTATPESSRNHAMLLSQLPLVQSDPINWQLLVQLAASSSSMMRRLLMVGVFVFHKIHIFHNLCTRF